MKQVTEKDVAIIILNWNAYDDTFECLKSLEHLTYPHYQIFLVDNDSKDGSFDKLQKDYENGKFELKIIFIQTGANLGFAGGNNVAIIEAYNQGYEYYWLLNNDTVVDSNALTPLVEVLENDERIGIVGSKIYYYNTNKIWFAGGIVNSWIGKTMHIGFKEEDVGQYDALRKVHYITGCSLFFKKEMLETVGYMDEDYFLYYEETDWNIRAAKKGWGIVYQPNSVVHHKVSISSGGEENLAPYVAYYDLRNSFIMIKRNYSNLHTIISFWYMVFKVCKKTLKILLKNQGQKKDRIKFILSGFYAAIKYGAFNVKDYKK